MLNYKRKVIKKYHKSDLEVDFENEANQLKKYNHKHIVKYEDFFKENEEDYYLVIEFCDV